MLSGDIILAKGTMLVFEGNATLDLRGFELKATDSFHTILFVGDRGQEAALTLEDSSISNSGVIGYSGTPSSENQEECVYIYNGSLTMNGGRIEGYYYGVYNALETFTMNGGVIQNCEVGVANSGTMYANGGTVKDCTEYAMISSGTVQVGSGKTGTNFKGDVTSILGPIENGIAVKGLGTEAHPYELTTAAELKAFRDLVNSATAQSRTNSACAVLMNDIDLGGEEWTPIGEGNEINLGNPPYTGTFDGNGHTISGLNVSGDLEYAGLFGVVTGGTIKNLTVAGSVKGSAADDSVAGGIAGKATGSTIEACANLCSVSANQYVGGIVGMIHNTTVRDCYNVGTVTGGSNAGGIVGRTPPQSSNTIANCYSVGNVSASSCAGGILGNAGGDSVSNCYYLKETAQKAIGMVDDSYTANRTAAEFADGTVLKLLKAGQRTGDDPWDDTCRYVPKAGKYLPVFKYQDSYEPAPESSSGSRFSYATISAIASENGKVSPSGETNVRSDLGQTFTFTPDKGCRVADVLVNGKSVGALRSYTFATARSDQTIEVIFEKIPAFVDVPAGSYYEEAVNWALENWITEGTSDTRFSPDAPCTRAQAVTFLWRAAGCPAPKSYTTAFEDVTSGSYYYQAVLWAIENGIAQGTSETTFEPDALCTRAQIVTLLFRYKAASGMIAVTLAELLGGYADSAEIPAYSRSALNWAISANVLQGSGEKLLPNDACTRVQIVTLLYRTMP